jgi:hypothetical protein
MIDRQARDKLAGEIRHFVECFTDNFQFDDAAWEIHKKDRGVTKIYEAMWLTYDDLTRHKILVVSKVRASNARREFS